MIGKSRQSQSGFGRAHSISLRCCGTAFGTPDVGLGKAAPLLLGAVRTSKDYDRKKPTKAQYKVDYYLVVRTQSPYCGTGTAFGMVPPDVGHYLYVHSVGTQTKVAAKLHFPVCTGTMTLYSDHSLRYHSTKS